MPKENVIIIMIDGGRLDHAQKSKVFSKIESKSVFLSQSITYAPHTIAAMHAVFSGSYGSRTGTNSYWSTFKFKKNKFKTLTEYLHDNQYHTHADVINELVVPKQGFDNYIIHDEENDDLSERHKNLLHQMNEKFLNGENFFLYLHYSNIHTGIKNEVLKVYDNHSEEFFENKEINKNRYKRLFVNSEKYLEYILNEIKKLKIDENSLILIMSDHGVSVGEKFGERAYAAFCYDYTLRTFTYFLTKNLPICNIKQQTRTIDFMPTILDYLRIPLDSTKEGLDGISLLPLIQNSYDAKMTEEYAYSETANPLYEKQPPKTPNVMSIRWDNPNDDSIWKLIYNAHDDTKELYDLSNDPSESSNLIGKNNQVETKLWSELLKIQQSSVSN